MKRPDHPETIAVVHSDVADGCGPEDKDTLETAAFLADLLEGRGLVAACLPYDLSLKENLDRIRPAGIFNLVESIGGSDRNIHEAPLAFERWGYRFTGSGSRAISESNDKIRAKTILLKHDIPTAAFFSEKEIEQKKSLQGPVILKARGEHASVGIGPDSVTDDPEHLCSLLRDRKQSYGGEWFAESYIEGREFNISVIEGSNGPCVLPLAEIDFIDFPAGVPRIVDYCAKWDEKSVAYRNTQRRFLEEGIEPSLARSLREISLRCWRIFDLKGWARVDFRVDREGNPFVLEINANPCLAPDAGFMAAARQAGMTHGDVVGTLIKNLREQACYA